MNALNPVFRRYIANLPIVICYYVRYGQQCLSPLRLCYQLGVLYLEVSCYVVIRVCCQVAMHPFDYKCVAEMG